MNWWQRLFGGEGLERELDKELRFHFEQQVADNIRGGMTEEQARRATRLAFGGLSQVKEDCRESRGTMWVSSVAQDLRFTLRCLRRDRAFTVVAVLILALGIGANIAVFSVVDTILLRPLPFHDAGRLAWIAGNNGTGALSDTTFRVDAYEEIRKHNQSFQDMTAYVPFFASSDAKMTGSGEPRVLAGVWVAGNFFQMLGIQPQLGRLFTAEETVQGGRPAVLLSYAFWQRQFAGNPAIVGQAITLNDHAVTVVGVLPASFDFGSVFHPGVKVDIFTPVIMDDIRKWGHMLSMIGLLKPGVTVTQAQAEADVIYPQMLAAHPDWTSDQRTDFTIKITGLKEHVSGQLRRSLIVLWCAVGLILLIACANLSNLLLARAATRSKEFAMRSALGAGRSRLIRQLFTESLVLASMGAALGLAIAYALVLYLSQQGSIALPLLSSAHIDAGALAWTLLVACAATVFFGLVPTLRVSGINLQESLKDGGHGTSSGRKHDRMRAALVVSEVALACVLLVGAGLLLRSFLRVLDVDLGFEPSHAYALRVDFNDDGKAARRGAIFQEMLGRVRALPGIDTAGISDMLPLDRNRSWDLMAKGNQYSKTTNYDAFVYIVSPGYLDAIGMHLRRGRDIGWSDTATSPPVILINEAAARREWPGQNPIGREALGIGDGVTRVVGVVSDVHESSVEDAANPEVFVPITQGNPDGAELVVRSALPPGALAGSVMSTLRTMNPGQPAVEFRPIQQLVDHAVSPRRFFVLLVGIFAGLGLLLASLGIYGVISYSVTQQTQEIGIRMALGATQARVQLGVMARTLRLALIGIAVGIAASFAIAALIASLLFGTAPTDPITFAGMVLLLVAVAFVAGYLPARRASRIDPIVALRCN
jgi:predicted permease